MFEPTRGGTRGGQAQFKWTDVSADKDRENYLGHSINAPTGRWQKNQDVHWYNRDGEDGAAERAEELRKVKEAEAEALSVALGFGPSAKGTSSAAGGPGTGSNAVAVPVPAKAILSPEELEGKARAKEEKRKKKEEKAARKEEKRARKERRALKGHHRDGSSGSDDSYRRRDVDPRRASGGSRYDRSRSRSPRRDHVRPRSRSPRPVYGRRSSPPPRRLYDNRDIRDRPSHHDRPRSPPREGRRFDDRRRLPPSPPTREDDRRRR